MASSRRRAAGTLAALVLACVSGCQSRDEAPGLERLESVLGQSLPRDAALLGGRLSSPASGRESALWLVTTGDPLPLPGGREGGGSRRGVRGRSGSAGDTDIRHDNFPVSALHNLLAACRVESQRLPSLTGDRGTVHSWTRGRWQLSYREAPTETGWLTAVEAIATGGGE